MFYALEFIFFLKICYFIITGYYRVNYDLENWNLLIEQLIKNHTVIHPVNRAQLISDSYALAEAGIIPYYIPLNITSYLINEKDYMPWHSVLLAFRTIRLNGFFNPTFWRVKVW